MYKYVSSSYFWKKPWYLMFLWQYNHIDYKKNSSFTISGTCNWCFCSDFIISYQCFLDYFIYKIDKM